MVHVVICFASGRKFQFDETFSTSENDALNTADGSIDMGDNIAGSFLDDPTTAVTISPVRWNIECVYAFTEVEE